MKRILLVIVAANMLLYSTFTRDDRGIVTDSTTGLEWQDNKIVYKNWIEGISYCEELTLGGYSDWKMPNINELLSIFDYSNFSFYSVFENVSHNYYWSSTTVVDSNISARTVFPGSGFAYPNLKSNGSYTVRCVRTK